MKASMKAGQFTGVPLPLATSELDLKTLKIVQNLSILCKTLYNALKLKL